MNFSSVAFIHTPKPNTLPLQFTFLLSKNQPKKIRTSILERKVLATETISFQFGIGR